MSIIQKWLSEYHSKRAKSLSFKKDSIIQKRQVSIIQKGLSEYHQKGLSIIQKGQYHSNRAK